MIYYIILSVFQLKTGVMLYSIFIDRVDVSKSIQQQINKLAWLQPLPVGPEEETTWVSLMNQCCRMELHYCVHYEDRESPNKLCVIP